MALERVAGLPPVVVGGIGSCLGVLIAWGLAHQEQYLLWSLVGAALLFAFSTWRAPTFESLSLQRRVPLAKLLRSASGLLLTVAWVSGPSPLALLTGFWAFQLFAELRPARPGILRGPEGGIPARMADLSPALWAFCAVMLPLRLWVAAPWSATAGIH